MILCEYQLVGNYAKYESGVENLSDFFNEPLVDLEDIEKFNCSGNTLTTLPLEIGKCTKLGILICHDNNLETLPPEIGKCTKLRVLNCYNNKLTALPPEIGKCVYLEKLNCSSNELTTLPPELGMCTHLKEFSFHDNALTSFPLEIVKCINLNGLYWYQNHFIDSLSFERLKSIFPHFLGDNRWQDIKEQIFTPISDQYPDLSVKEIQEQYPDVSYELTKMYIESGEIQKTDLPRQKSARKA